MFDFKFDLNTSFLFTLATRNKMEQKTLKWNSYKDFIFMSDWRFGYERSKMASNVGKIPCFETILQRTDRHLSFDQHL